MDYSKPRTETSSCGTHQLKTIVDGTCSSHPHAHTYPETSFSSLRHTHRCGGAKGEASSRYRKARHCAEEPEGDAGVGANVVADVCGGVALVAPTMVIGAAVPARPHATRGGWGCWLELSCTSPTLSNGFEVSCVPPAVASPSSPAQRREGGSAQVHHPPQLPRLGVGGSSGGAPVSGSRRLRWRGSS